MPKLRSGRVAIKKKSFIVLVIGDEGKVCKNILVMSFAK